MTGASTIAFREAGAADFDALSAVLIEVQAHYRAPCPRREAIIEGLERRPAGTRILLAREGTDIAGFASFAGIYPGPGLTSGFFLKDLFVRAQWRGTGVGKALMTELARIAASEGIARIDWTASREDVELRRFYEKIGGNALSDRQFFRLNGDALKNLGSAKRSTS